MSHTRAWIPSYLVQTDDLAIGFLDLPQLHKKVPESGLGNDCVWGEYSHAVEFGCRVAL